MSQAKNLFKNITDSLVRDGFATREQVQRMHVETRVDRVIPELCHTFNAGHVYETVARIRGEKFFGTDQIRGSKIEQRSKDGDANAWLLTNDVLYTCNPYDRSFELVSQNISFSETGILCETVLETSFWSASIKKNEIQEITTHRPDDFLDKILIAAISNGASDIHLIPNSKGKISVDYRIDGKAVPLVRYNIELHESLVRYIMESKGGVTLSPLKVQDARFEHKLPNGRYVDVRVSRVPTTVGSQSYQRVTMRLRSQSTAISNLNDLGIVGSPRTELVSISRRPTGLVIVTGPTGAGKSSTMVAMLNESNKFSPGKIFYTLEAPVEQQIPFATQINIDDNNITFASGMKCLLRMDPDVIMFGEIRNHEDASKAAEGGNTGHLVLTTLHTTNAHSSINRLIELGVSQAVVCDTILAITAQRLVRKLCPECKIQKPLSSEPDLLKQFKSHKLFRSNPDIKLYFENRGGCDQCRNGFQGRMPVIEVLSMTKNLYSRIMAKETPEYIRESQIRNGEFETIWDNALEACTQGLVSLKALLKELDPYENDHPQDENTKVLTPTLRTEHVE